MGSTLRRVHPGVANTLSTQPYRFEFFQAVRVLLALKRRACDGGSESESHTLDETVRFRTTLSLAFPASEIEHVVMRGGATTGEQPDASWEMVVNFMGMVGPSGVLPHCYTERLLERKIYFKDTAAHAFLDIFTHRMISLFFEAHKKYSLSIAYELQPDCRKIPQISALFGMGLPGMQNRFDADGSRVTVESLSYYAGLLIQRPRSASNLVRILEDHFGVPFQLDQFVGRWIDLAEEQCTTLGIGNSGLGASAIVGERVWDRQTTVGLCIGPLPRRQFSRFLPAGEDARELKKILRFFSGINLDYRIRLLLKKEEIAAARLGGDEVLAARLGWDCLVFAGAANRDMDGAGYMLLA